MPDMGETLVGSLAPHGDGQAAGDSAYPGKRVVTPADLGPLLPGPAERLLGAVLGEGEVAGGGVDEVDHLASVPVVELVESVLPGWGAAHRPVSYTHLRAHETGRNLVCRLLLEKK